MSDAPFFSPCHGIILCVPAGLWNSKTLYDEPSRRKPNNITHQVILTTYLACIKCGPLDAITVCKTPSRKLGSEY